MRPKNYPDKVIAHAANIGISDFGQDCMRRMFAHYDIHGLVGSPRVLEWIIGRPPTDFETFAETDNPATGRGRISSLKN